MAILKIHDTLGKVIFQTKRGLNVSRWSDRLIELPKWFSNAAIKDMDMTQVNMSATTFDEASMEDINFYCARLCAVNWVSCNIEDVNFTRASMTANDFYRGKISGVDFALADLRGSVFSGTRIYDSLFNMADLRGVQFDMKETWIESFVSSCDFEHAKLDGCTINNKPIRGWIEKFDPV